MTKLACLLRDEKRYSEADSAFREALAIRSKLFGPNSDKANGTRAEYAKMPR